jgi:hypothetical protein
MSTHARPPSTQPSTNTIVLWCAVIGIICMIMGFVLATLVPMYIKMWAAPDAPASRPVSVTYTSQVQPYPLVRVPRPQFVPYDYKP